MISKDIAKSYTVFTSAVVKKIEKKAVEYLLNGELVRVECDAVKPGKILGAVQSGFGAAYQI